MITLNRKEDCCGCSACQQVCPAGAIRMVADEEGFLYPAVDQDKCILCNRCNIICPNKKSSAADIQADHKLYAAYRKDLKERMNSASGGIFAVIAEWIIEQNGAVYGAAYQEDFSVAHIKIETKEALARLLGSKYVQSSLGDIFQSVKKDVKAGRNVLFCGTPCQTAGLKSYLGKDNENVLFIDFVCHGVPSPKIWRQYLNEIAHGRKIKRIVPRDKRKSIVNCPITIYFEDGTAFSQKYESNAYLRGFAANLFSRPSCYACRQKGIERCSDITLADFWGIEREKPAFGDSYGISAVLTHSKKGAQVIDCVEEKLILEEASLCQFIPYNPSAVSSVDNQPLRKSFFALVETKGVCKSVSALLGNANLLMLQKQLADLKYILLVCVKKVRLLLRRR